MSAPDVAAMEAVAREVRLLILDLEEPMRHASEARGALRLVVAGAIASADPDALPDALKALDRDFENSFNQLSEQVKKLTELTRSGGGGQGGAP